jgi:predicted kinase
MTLRGRILFNGWAPALRTEASRVVSARGRISPKVRFGDGSVVEAVIFVGLQAAGKSTFYKQQFFTSHVRVNLDMLKTRRRERLLFQLCIDVGQSFVVDNTNPTRAEREVYIRAAKDAGFKVTGYYFQSRVDDCLRRNEQRAIPQQVPLPGILGTARKMTAPNRDEGFDELFYVRIGEAGDFVVEGWRDEIH